IKIFEDEFNPEIRENYIQLIPLTPSTSFNMTLGCGSVTERALIYAILRRYYPLKPLIADLEIMMADSAYINWERHRDTIDQRVRDCNLKSNGAYLTTMLEKVDDFFQENPSFMQELHDVCNRINEEGESGKRVDGQTKVVQKLRKIMAEISVDLIDAD